MQEKKKIRDDWRIDLDNLVESLRRRQLVGFQIQGKKTLEVLRQIVDKYTWKNSNELYNKIRDVGFEITCIDPLAFSVSTTVRRLLNVIRKEHMKLIEKQSKNSHYFEEIRTNENSLSGDVSMNLLRSAIFEGINELLHEFGQSWDFDLCLDIFTSNETILVDWINCY